MAPSESSILRNFLLPPAPVAVALPFEQFQELFPRSLQANPKIQDLYRELQRQRAIDIDDVRRNIEVEVKKGEQQRREVIRARRKSQEVALKGVDQQELIREAEVNKASALWLLLMLIRHQLLNQPPEKSLSPQYTLESIIPAMEEACGAIDAEIAAMEKESEELLTDIRTTIGDLSDLRYGKFNHVSGFSSDMNQEVIQGLSRLDELCRVTEKG